jgi:hypothetical protein
MTGLSGLTSRLRPAHARGLLIAGLLVSLIPLSRKTPKTQVLLLELPARFRETEGRVEVSWTREGDTEPLGGFTLTFPEGAPASLRREISAPDGKYRLDVSLEAVAKSPATSRAPAPVEITRELSLDGARVRVLFEDTPP